ncbi:MAG: hypothetical protein Q4F11_01785 [Eubacteriales bacterium]|nr:hypothetical protein [Eubacteriales bacterium]
MLEIIFLLLKIAGIILLSVIGLIVLLLLIILFAPVHYCIKADYHGTLRADIKVTWLAHIVRGRFIYKDNKAYMKAKLLWFCLFGEDKAKGSHGKRKKIKQKKEKNIFDGGLPQDYKNNPEADKEAADNISLKALEKTALEHNTAKAYDEAGSSLALGAGKKTKKSIFLRAKNKILSLAGNIIRIIKNIFKKAADVYNKIIKAKESLSEKAGRVIEIINDPDNKKLFEFVKQQLIKLFKLIKPSKYIVDFHFGFEDPETTGKAAMWLACLYGFLGLDIGIKPDFENEVLEADIYLKGHVQIFWIAVIAVKCYTNKQIRKFINK